MRNTLALTLAVGLVAFMMSAPAYAASCGGVGQLPCGQCDITQGGTATPACPSNNPDQAITTPYQAVRSDPGTSGVTSCPSPNNDGCALNAIDVANYCRWVDNKTSGANATSIFVPFNTAINTNAPEWTDFIAAVNTPNSAVSKIARLGLCAISVMPPISLFSPDSDPKSPTYCGPPATPIGGPSPLPYQRGTVNGYYTGSSTQNYNCTCASGGPFTEAATITFNAYPATDGFPPVYTDKENTSGWGTPGPIQYSVVGSLPPSCSAGACNSAYTGTVGYYQGVTLQTEIYGGDGPEPDLCTSSPGGTADSLPATYVIAKCPDHYCATVPQGYAQGKGNGNDPCVPYCLCSLINWTCPGSNGGAGAGCGLIIHPANVGCFNP